MSELPWRLQVAREWAPEELDWGERELLKGFGESVAQLGNRRGEGRRRHRKTGPASGASEPDQLSLPQVR